MLGSKVVTMFPGVVWQLPAAKHGALVLLVSGALQKIGVRDNSVVTAADGEPIRTASELAHRLRKGVKGVKVDVGDGRRHGQGPGQLIAAAAMDFIARISTPW